MFDDIIKTVREDGTKTSMSADATAATVGSATQIDLENPAVRIAVIGVGGAGCNCVTRIDEGGIKSARTIAINTDGKHLNMMKSHQKFLAGRAITRGLGAGGDLNIGLE